jgi:hypothetical protein
MASDKLQKILAMSKNMDKQGKKINNAPPTRPMKTATSLVERVNNADKTIANIDAMYNAPYIPSKEEKETWNTERGREELTEMADQKVFMEKLNHSHLPKAILESMRQNPCNYDPTIVNHVMGPENEFFKKLNEAYGKDKEEPVRGVKAVQQINEQLDNRDKQTVEENVQRTSNNSSVQNIDLDSLEQLIERVIDRKFNVINESLTRNSTNTIKSMSITESGIFRFLDSEDNVYECQMKYLGKRKRSKK